MGCNIGARLAAYADDDWRRRRIDELAATRSVSPLEALLDLAVAEPALRVACVLANDDPDEVAHLLVQDHVTLGLSDAGAHVGQICDAPQATDYLGRCVRDRALLPLEEAVRRLTSVQADLVVFDPDTIGPGRNGGSPTSLAAGSGSPPTSRAAFATCS